MGPKVPKIYYKSTLMSAQIKITQKVPMEMDEMTRI